LSVSSPPAASLTRWHASLHHVTVAGRRMHYLDAGSGPPVLLVHGIGCDWTHWSANLDALTQAHRVIAVDMPGFGASEALSPKSELAATGDAVLALMDALEIPRFAMVGHSLGGLISWLVTAAAPERVTALGLVDAATVELTPLQSRAIVRGFTLGGHSLAHPGVARAILRRPRLRRLVLASFFADITGVSAELAVALLTPLTVAPGFHDALAAGARAISQLRPEELQTPTLIVWGTKDPVFTVGAARRLAARMPQAMLLEIPGARHWAMLERPELFNPALLEFLAANELCRRGG
jgi:pimeloyl-ACP methyl ester carboxylesterase